MEYAKEAVNKVLMERRVVADFCSHLRKHSNLYRRKIHVHVEKHLWGQNRALGFVALIQVFSFAFEVFCIRRWKMSD